MKNYNSVSLLFIGSLFCISQDAFASPSFQKDIRPIFEKRCSMCHNNEVWKERNWLDYDTAVKNKDKILNRVWTTKDMPPSGDIPMNERVLIKKWIDTGTSK